MEVIAIKFPRKATFILILSASLFLLLAGVVLLVVYSMIPTWDEDVYSYIAVFLIVVGLATTIMSLIGTVKYLRLPQVLITYENGVFTLPKGEKIEAHKLMDIKYTVANPSYKNVTVDMGFGQISFVADGKKYNVKYTAQTLNVYQRITEIVDEQRLLK